MAELTAEVVAKIVKDEVGQLRGEMNIGFQQIRSEMNDGFNQVRLEMTDGLAQLRNEMTDGFAQVRNEMTDGFTQVLDAMDSIADGHDDEIGTIKTRLRSHGERLTRLERHNNLR